MIYIDIYNRWKEMVSIKSAITTTTLYIIVFEDGNGGNLDLLLVGFYALYVIIRLDIACILIK
jgi:hypothetical protein